MRSTPPSILIGLVRLEPRIVPPRGRMPRTCGMPSGVVTPSSGPFQPSRNPTNSKPYSVTPLRTTARMTALRPGQSPPPVSTPTRMVLLMALGTGQGRARLALSIARRLSNRTRGRGRSTSPERAGRRRAARRRRRRAVPRAAR